VFCVFLVCFLRTNKDKQKACGVEQKKLRHMLFFFYWFFAQKR